MISSYRGGIFGAGDGGPPGAHRTKDSVPVTYKFLQRPTWLRGEDQDAGAISADPRTMISLHDFLRSRLRSESPAEWAIFLPYWLLILLTALTWLALLFWRARRRSKAIVV